MNTTQEYQDNAFALSTSPVLAPGDIQLGIPLYGKDAPKGMSLQQRIRLKRSLEEEERRKREPASMVASHDDGSAFRGILLVQHNDPAECLKRICLYALNLVNVQQREWSLHVVAGQRALNRPGGGELTDDRLITLFDALAAGHKKRELPLFVVEAVVRREVRKSDLKYVSPVTKDWEAIKSVEVAFVLQMLLSSLRSRKPEVRKQASSQYMQSRAFWEHYTSVTKETLNKAKLKRIEDILVGYKFLKDVTSKDSKTTRLAPGPKSSLIPRVPAPLKKPKSFESSRTGQNSKLDRRKEGQ